MSRRQVEVCAARLPVEARAQFLALIAESADLFNRSIELRKRAWLVYRSIVPLEAERAERRRKRGVA